jgi:hypothetical protein
MARARPTPAASRPRTRIARAIAPAALLTAALVFGGCRATPVAAGGSGGGERTSASFRLRTLRADLPPGVRVPAVAAAAEDALRDRGYAVTSSRVTEDSAHLSAAPPDADLFESVDVSARQTAGGTRVSVVCEPLGNRNRSSAILDAILARLGM